MRVYKNLKCPYNYVAALLALLSTSLGALVLWASLSNTVFLIPSFQQVRNSYSGSEAVLLDRHRHLLHEIRIDPKGRRLSWIGLAEVSPALQAAVVNAEDKRFYEHKGVDWKASAGALIGRIHSRNLRGASTLPMQLVSRLIPELQPLDSHRSLWQKWKQMVTARKLEKSWSKPEILEAYLNLVSFRGELQGISSVSRGLLNKRPHGLDDTESVILAALLRAPNASIDDVARRACELAEGMNLHLSCLTIRSRTQEALSAPYQIEPEIALAPHVCQQLIGSRALQLKGSPVEAICTLDRELQRFVSETLQQHILSVQGQNVHDGAVLVADNKSGEILAYVGNVGAKASARFVDGTKARRQAGSTLKPFLYGLAFDKRILTPASLLDDAPLDVPAMNGIYRPQNYDKQFHGLVPVRTALASSLNIPAVKVLNLVGVEWFVQKLGECGFEKLQSADFYGSSLALGAADVTLWELVNAYRSLANAGVWSPLRLTFEENSGVTRRRVLSAESAFLVSDILSDRESRSETFHLESPLSTRFWTAVKTGTSKDMRDNWCVGFSEHYTVGVWAGNFSGDPMWNVSGITGAAPAWIEIMNWLHRGLPSCPPEPPSGVTSRHIEFSVPSQNRSEWFLKGTESSTVQPVSSPTNFRIVYPVSDAIIALDPDIPQDQQKVFFESHPKEDRLNWRLDGKEIGRAGSVLLWTPLKGKHHLCLIDEANRTLDSVEFEVRGNLHVSSSPNLSSSLEARSLR
jgi:penicillin-binding protein 1C